MRRALRTVSDDSGQTAIALVVSILLFSLLGALVFDFGLMYDQRLRAQAAADFAALAGVQELPGDAALARQIAEEYLAANGYDPNDVEVTAVIDAPFEGNYDIRVKVNREFGLLLGRSLGFLTAKVGATAVAGERISDIVAVIDRSGSMWDDWPDGANNPHVSIISEDIGSGFTESDLDDNLSPNLDGELSIDVDPGAGSFSIDGFVVNYNANSDSLDDVVAAINATVPGVEARVETYNDRFMIWREQSGAGAALAVADITGNFLEAMHIIDDDGDVIGTESLGGDPLTAWQPFGDVLSATIAFSEIFDSTIDRLALVSYAANPSLDCDLDCVFGPQGDDDFELTTLNLYPDGFTNIGGAIEVAHQELLNNSREGAQLVIVLLTDGVPNRCGSLAAGWTTCFSGSGAADYARSAATAARADGILIYTVGLGSSLDEDLLEDLAEIGTGVYINAPTVAELEATFEEVASLFRISLLQ